ncbi:helix-turn-helix domain-containing protein [Desulfovibrio piger]|uniref:AlbA family DNA-binding domain-containing protein n=1 Tax=Desulfovibrio piger TaxID=901 RepID=UPI0024327F65|nr:RNA-binding domain-containing protein [Desulfovibrio piger]MCI7507117.1 putative DNA binding domain-containing protein [Desulfovibrio piger]
MYEKITITKDQVQQLFASIEENYFNDFKDIRITPAKLSATVSAFANASGGDIYVGIYENNKTKEKIWAGFNNLEDANAHIQTIIKLSPLDNFINISFLSYNSSLVLHIAVSKTKSIINATNGIPYVRHNAQNIPVNTPQEIERLKLDKGIVSFEDESVSETSLDDILDSSILTKFIRDVVPKTDNISWIRRQKLFYNEHLTVAGTLLFTDEPQIFLPKRSSIKVFRYKTSGNADRDVLAGTPETIEGCAYNQIYDAVKKVKNIIESIKNSMESL